MRPPEAISEPRGREGDAGRVSSVPGARSGLFPAKLPAPAARAPGRPAWERSGASCGGRPRRRGCPASPSPPRAPALGARSGPEPREVAGRERPRAGEIQHRRTWAGGARNKGEGRHLRVRGGRKVAEAAELQPLWVRLRGGPRERLPPLCRIRARSGWEDLGVKI